MVTTKKRRGRPPGSRNKVDAAPAHRPLTANDIQVGGSHYKTMGVQPWEAMETLLTHDEFLGFLKGNMIKYAMRQGKKDSPDAGKYHHYKKKLNEVTEGETWL